MSLAREGAHGRMLLAQWDVHWRNAILPCAGKCSNNIMPCAQRYVVTVHVVVIKRLIGMLITKFTGLLNVNTIPLPLLHKK